MPMEPLDARARALGTLGVGLLGPSLTPTDLASAARIYLPSAQVTLQPQWVDGDLYNGRIVRVANSFVFKAPVFNYSGDFPFLWDEIRIPIRFGSDRAEARAIILQVADRVVGEYARTSAVAWKGMVRKYRIEDASVAPMLTLVATDNWLQYTLRYVVDYRRRRGVQDALFNGIMDLVDASNGRVQLASATYELVAAPPITVQTDAEGR